MRITEGATAVTAGQDDLAHAVSALAAGATTNYALGIDNNNDPDDTTVATVTTGSLTAGDVVYVIIITHENMNQAHVKLEEDGVNLGNLSAIVWDYNQTVDSAVAIARLRVLKRAPSNGTHTYRLSLSVINGNSTDRGGTRILILSVKGIAS
mgnify:CR=1 FL=1